MQVKKVTQASLIILSYLWLSCAIKRINNKSRPSRRSFMGPITRDCHGPSGKPHPGGREPHQSHGNIGWMTNQNCTATGCQSLDWQHHQKGCNSSINPWRGLNTVHVPFSSKKGFLKCYHSKDHSLLPHQRNNCHSIKVNIYPSVKVKICHSSKCQVCLPTNVIDYVLPLLLLLSDM